MLSIGFKNYRNGAPNCQFILIGFRFDEAQNQDDLGQNGKLY
jgi:hypothetical protein